MKTENNSSGERTYFRLMWVNIKNNKLNKLNIIEFKSLFFYTIIKNE